MSKNEDGEYDYSPVMATMLSEVDYCSFFHYQILKLAISFFIFKFQVWKDPSIRRSFTLKEIFLWSIPAFLYAIGHNVYYYILSIIDTPVTIQVFGSLETVIVGVFSVLVLKKK